MEMTLSPRLVELYQICRNDAYLSLHPKKKNPIKVDWRNQPVSAEDALAANQMLQHNIGILNGTTSALIDIDLDCAEAVAFADLFLPDTVASFGHEGNGRGHYLVAIKSSGKTRKFNMPDSSECLVELRSDGTQTMLPPSIHPSGHKLQFSYINDSAPAVDYADLLVATQRIAACSVIARSWSEGSRHQLALAFAGMMYKADFDQDLAENVVNTICDFTGDEELDDRLNAVATTYAQDASSVSGYGIMVDVLGVNTARKIAEWLDIGANNTDVIEADGAAPTILPTTHEDEITEEKMAEAFTRWAKKRAVYVHEKKQWYLWDGLVWKPDPSNAVRLLVSEFVSAAGAAQKHNRRFEDALRRFENLSKIKNTLELAQPRLAKSITDFDTDPMLFAAGNTWIDLKTGQPVTPQANTLVSLQSSVRYDPEADCPVFKSFLNEIFLDNDALVKFVQRTVGYSLTGRIDEQCFFPMNGDGANGKSTLLNILSKLMGDYSKTAAATTLMANQREGVGDDLIHLAGARMITVSETDKDQPLAEAKLKRMTGGDEITARALYGSYTTFKIMGKIFVATNSLPKVNGRDHGIFRRFQIVPFNRTFMPHEQDKALPDKLEAELSGILNWAIRGCLEWQQQGLNPPQIVMDQLDHYQQDMDTVGKFVDAQLVLDPASKIQSSELYQEYRLWCQRMGYNLQDDKQFKASMLRIDGVAYGRSKAVRHYAGVRYHWDEKDVIEVNDKDVLF
ncbi:phage/plasmid primase, P4 family [Alphaproteobacteria bacterium US3C007]|jgi:putative DNA primase/helicase|nr:phage/plasmid primase, P4 family [Alphaproteobacteria bacterium US3C007]